MLIFVVSQRHYVSDVSEKKSQILNNKTSKSLSNMKTLNIFSLLLSTARIPEAHSCLSVIFYLITFRVLRCSYSWLYIQHMWMHIKLEKFQNIYLLKLWFGLIFIFPISIHNIPIRKRSVYIAPKILISTSLLNILDANKNCTHSIRITTPTRRRRRRRRRGSM